MHDFYIPINFAVIIRKCIESKHAVECFTFVNQEIIYGKEENQVTPICVFPTRLNGKCYWVNTFGELNVKICEKTSDVCIETALQTKWSIELLVVALFNRIHIYVLDWARIRHHLKHLTIDCGQCNVIQTYDMHKCNTNLFHIYIL